jgi:hypothetical protein
VFGGPAYWLTRYLFQRALGLVFLIAFLCALRQFRPLLGEHGLLPAPEFIRSTPFRESPSIFYIAPHDWAFQGAAWLGMILSALVISGVTTRYGTWFAAATWGLIWLLYLSFVNVGQIFYGFGWESILLEAGFFAMFLGSDRVEPSGVSLVMLRWLEFRVMFGAGLIKLRGDPCWRDLTCLNYHYETQPMPNPLSWYFHNAPQWTRQGGVIFNHFAELIVPIGYLLPQPYASIAGAITILFQAAIMASGNLSWLNLLTITLALPMISFPGVVRELATPGPIQKYATLAVAILVLALSVPPIVNMFSPRQIMNTSFNPLHLVGTYGAFGSVTRVRQEIVVEGTSDAVITPATQWSEYEFFGKPGALWRRPPQIAPYHLRLDWMMWFAAMGDWREQPWFIPFVVKLLQNDPDTLSLLRANPFQNQPPKFIRATLYRYSFTTPDDRRRTDDWWQRERLGLWFPPVSLKMLTR